MEAFPLKQLTDVSDKEFVEAVHKLSFGPPLSEKLLWLILGLAAGRIMKNAEEA